MPKTDSNTAKYRPKRAKNVSDFIGQQFGHLVILSEAERDVKRPNHQQALCKCECGNIAPRLFTHMLKGRITSCGRCNLPRRKHGHAPDGKSTPTYISWDCMTQRITNPNNIAYHNYGGRGLTICAGLQTFTGFLQKLKDKPEGKTLDRQKNDLGYWCGKCKECKAAQRPSNVRWATRSQQMRNTRQNRYLTFKDQTLCATEWAETLTIPRRVIYSRLSAGWSDDKTLTTPYTPQSKQVSEAARA